MRLKIVRVNGSRGFETTGDYQTSHIEYSVAVLEHLSLNAIPALKKDVLIYCVYTILYFRIKSNRKKLFEKSELLYYVPPSFQMFGQRKLKSYLNPLLCLKKIYKTKFNDTFYTKINLD